MARTVLLSDLAVNGEECFDTRMSSAGKLGFEERFGHLLPTEFLIFFLFFIFFIFFSPTGLFFFFLTLGTLMIVFHLSLFLFSRTFKDCFPLISAFPIFAIIT